MENEINRVCPMCGTKLKSEMYNMNHENEHKMGKLQMIVYCDNCNEFCTDSTLPSRVLEELKCIKK